MRIPVSRWLTTSPMHSRRRLIELLACAFASLALPASAKASLTIDFIQSGGNVVATASGEINLAALTFVNTEQSTSFVDPTDTIITLVATSGGDVYSNGAAGFSGPASWGPGGPSFAPSSSGDPIGLIAGSFGEILVPQGYTSGESISGTATWKGETYSSLGLDAGTYTYTWGTGPTADSFTLQVGGSATVPEPATIWLAAIGATGFAAHARFTRSKKQRTKGQAGPSRAADLRG